MFTGCRNIKNTMSKPLNFGMDMYIVSLRSQFPFLCSLLNFLKIFYCIVSISKLLNSHSLPLPIQHYRDMIWCDTIAWYNQKGDQLAPVLLIRMLTLGENCLNFFFENRWAPVRFFPGFMMPIFNLSHIGCRHFKIAKNHNRTTKINKESFIQIPFNIKPQYSSVGWKIEQTAALQCQWNRDNNAQDQFKLWSKSMDNCPYFQGV